jgi:hypothetical protein
VGRGEWEGGGAMSKPRGISFYDALCMALDMPELVAQFDRLYGASLGKNLPPIARAVDDATGKTEADVLAFIEFFHECVWTRLPEEAFAHE